MSYRIVFAVEFEADDIDEARETATRLGTMVFNEPEVMTLEAAPPRWIPVRPSGTHDEPYTEWARRLGLMPSGG